MRTNLKVTAVGEQEQLSGGAPKLPFKALNEKGQEIICLTYKSNVISGVVVGAELDVDVDVLKYSDRNGQPYDVYKITWLHTQDEGNGKNPQSAQSGTWREEKAAEIIGNLLCACQIKPTHKLAKKLFKWLDESLD